MQQLQPLLENIGLNHHESAIYLHLLQSGERPASAIAKETAIPRSTTRGVLDKLCERGIVSKLYKRNTQYYTCKDPQALLQYVKSTIKSSRESLSTLQSAMPLFLGLHAQRGVIPKVQYFEGKEGVIEAFNHSLFVEDIDELLFFTSYKFLLDPVIRNNDIEFFIPLRVKKKIPIRVLVGKTEQKLAPVSVDKKELRERRLFPEDYELPGNFHIYGDFVAYFSAGENEYIALVIESSLMASTMRALFEFTWRNCRSR